jgi:hypothetical protein
VSTPEERPHHILPTSVAAAAEIERQIAVTFVMGVEEDPLLLSVTGVFEGIEVQYDPLRVGTAPLHEHVQQDLGHPLDIRDRNPILPTAQRGLPRQGRGPPALPQRHLQQRIVTQHLRVIGVRVTLCNQIDPLPKEIGERMLYPSGIPRVLDGRRQSLRRN